MPFKIGSFNLIPSFTVMTICIAGVGAVPFYVRYALNGEAPSIKDRFEAYQGWRPAVWDKEAPHAATYDFRHAEIQKAKEALWRKAHEEAGAAPKAVHH